MTKPLLEVADLRTQFESEEGVIRAVNGVSFTVDEGRVLGIVGESGCGKSVTALSIMRLIDPPGRVTSGKVLFHDDGSVRDLLALPQVALEEILGNRISMIFQDPLTSLNPVLTVGYQIMEPLRVHRRMPAREARAEAAHLLRRVGIPGASARLDDYPHQFSGGMRQRVMIAMAVACRPKLLIADEPTTALDVTIQAQILNLLRELKRELGTSVVIITHDLGVIAQLADRVAVMYAGRIVEDAPVAEIFDAPRHPYTRALVASIPRLNEWHERLPTIEGAPPCLRDERGGCAFEPRCASRIPRCAHERPPLVELSNGHAVACWVAQEEAS
ncbi:MAG: peptide/nickel transport system ATP-binding protein [Acidobacteriota bacterium]|nr:peptide/nickel transport system ATP-binding protein [Acidobacteriota bacterium]